MSVTTPRLTGGWHVDSTNYLIDFECATHAGSYQASLRYGTYVAAEFATEVARAMNTAHAGAGDTFTCVYTFSTRKFTIDNGVRLLTLRFDLNTGTNAAGLLGFDDATTGSASGHDSTDTVGVTNSFFAAAGVFGWAPTDPVHSTGPVVAAADGTTATLMRRVALGVQNRFDGGQREHIHMSTDKILELTFRWIAGTERTRFEEFLAWAEKGRRFNYQPDATATEALRLMLRDPGDSGANHEWLTRSEISYATMTFVEALTRT